jgi:hypothetical protein
MNGAVNLPAVLFAAGAALIALYLVGRSRRVRSRSRARTFADLSEPAPAPVAADEEQGFLTRWLALAGFRGPDATAAFVAATLLLAAVGLAAALTIVFLGVARRSAAVLGDVPGGVGDLLLPAVYGTRESWPRCSARCRSSASAPRGEGASRRSNRTCR